MHTSAASGGTATRLGAASLSLIREELGSMRIDAKAQFDPVISFSEKDETLDFDVVPRYYM
jgi:hypothetical protein